LLKLKINDNLITKDKGETMKLMKIITIGLSLLLAISCSKTDAEDKALEADGSEIVTVNLPSIQCSMCEKTIEKGLSKREGVVSIDVNIDEKNAKVVYEAGLIDLAGIEKAIAGLGYQANKTLADSETYADLAKCCKLPEDR
jgi:mercuric ion binding protein